VVRPLWPRILYWFSLVLMLIGLFYAVTGITNTPTLAAQSTTQSGGALFALIALVGLLGAKYWMDWVVRKRAQLPCPACGKRNHFTAMHCSVCGTALRVLRTQEVVPTQAPPALGLVCSTCGQTNGPGSRFCVSCGTKLQAASTA
jgi:hypothetical protein